jgi:acetoacetate decarboxylase
MSANHRSDILNASPARPIGRQPAANRPLVRASRRFTPIRQRLHEAVLFRCRQLGMMRNGRPFEHTAMSIPVSSIRGMPAFSPYFPDPPARYRNVRFQWVTFRTDAAAVDAYLPDCFTPDPEGLCVAFGLSVGWCSAYGSFEEAGVFIRCLWRGRTGYFCPVCFLNSRNSIPAGREIYGTPKVAADVAVGVEERVMFTHVRIAGATVMSVRSTIGRPATAADLPIIAPAWRLKAIPRADGRGCDVLQLIDAAPAAEDVKVHAAYRGDGVVELAQSPVYDLSRLVPREYMGAAYAELDYSENFGDVVHDFLAP